eukprot:TRINITY_DN32837_c0_g2_i2.p1 TRINITY_DN32837_c0_g2~~TRINITY_DN32837_c0_g2_i2.p1  ORF type:complete len:1014 (+),score=209.71 TRINITY_DN32837_c0_g2_i2:184-3225(+)
MAQCYGAAPAMWQATPAYAEGAVPKPEGAEVELELWRPRPPASRLHLAMQPPKEGASTPLQPRPRAALASKVLSCSVVANADFIGSAQNVGGGGGAASGSREPRPLRSSGASSAAFATAEAEGSGGVGAATTSARSSTAASSSASPSAGTSTTAGATSSTAPRASRGSRRRPTTKMSPVFACGSRPMFRSFLYQTPQEALDVNAVRKLLQRSCRPSSPPSPPGASASLGAAVDQEGAEPRQRLPSPSPPRSGRSASPAAGGPCSASLARSFSLPGLGTAAGSSSFMAGASSPGQPSRRLPVTSRQQLARSWSARSWQANGVAPPSSQSQLPATGDPACRDDGPQGCRRPARSASPPRSARRGSPSRRGPSSARPGQVRAQSMPREVGAAAAMAAASKEEEATEEQEPELPPHEAAVDVFLRVRPVEAREQGEQHCIRTQGQWACVNDPGAMQSCWFQFEGIVNSCLQPSESGQREVFDMLGHRLVSRALDGFDACVFSMGHTGTGKTYTLIGTPEAPGLLPGILDRLLARDEAEGRKRAAVRLSCLELYMDRLRDLFAEEDRAPISIPGAGDRPSPEIRCHPQQGVYVSNLNEVSVEDPPSALRLAAVASRNRMVARTALNASSSRGHAVFQLTLDNGARLSVVDLAGRENERTTRNCGQTLSELAYINTSLFHLTNAIQALARSPSRTPRGLVPFRNSKLTLLLSEALLSSRTSLVATVSPALSSLEETLTTLRLAQAVRQISTRSSRNSARGRVLRRRGPSPALTFSQPPRALSKKASTAQKEDAASSGPATARDVLSSRSQRSQRSQRSLGRVPSRGSLGSARLSTGPRSSSPRRDSSPQRCQSLHTTPQKQSSLVLTKAALSQQPCSAPAAAAACQRRPPSPATTSRRSSSGVNPVARSIVSNWFSGERQAAYHRPSSTPSAVPTPQTAPPPRTVAQEPGLQGMLLPQQPSRPRPVEQQRHANAVASSGSSALVRAVAGMATEVGWGGLAEEPLFNDDPLLFQASIDCF